MEDPSDSCSACPRFGLAPSSMSSLLSWFPSPPSDERWCLWIFFRAAVAGDLVILDEMKFTMKSEGGNGANSNEVWSGGQAGDVCTAVP